MAAGISTATASRAILHLKHIPFLGPKPGLQRVLWPGRRRMMPNLAVCFVLKDDDQKLMGIPASEDGESDSSNGVERAILLAESVAEKVAEKMARKRSERLSYLVAAVMSSFGITSMAVMAVYYRFSWQMEVAQLIMWRRVERCLMQKCLVGMEFWARWAHKALWHASLWHMHESHHKPREGPFELNDVFAITNAVPAIALLSYGFFHKGLIPGLCFGAGLGITVFGIAYMFVHDGLVHRRFPVGPIADVPYFRRVASAHQLHHTDKFNGVPYGLFLGPKELEDVGGLQELEKEIDRRIRMSKNL